MLTLAARAAKLAKADLASEMVGEFPELQGLMGKYYALAQGEPQPIAAAIEDHYKPQGPSDRIPTDPVAIAVALADKFDTLAGFFAIDERPTGSKDPYALRRAALGIIRLILENGLRLPILTVSGEALAILHGSARLIPRIGCGRSSTMRTRTTTILPPHRGWPLGLGIFAGVGRGGSAAARRYLAARFSGEGEVEEADLKAFDELFAVLAPYQQLP